MKLDNGEIVASGKINISHPGFENFLKKHHELDTSMDDSIREYFGEVYYTDLTETVSIDTSYPENYREPSCNGIKFSEPVQEINYSGLMKRTGLTESAMDILLELNAPKAGLISKIFFSRFLASGISENTDGSIELRIKKSFFDGMTKNIPFREYSEPLILAFYAYYVFARYHLKQENNLLSSIALNILRAINARRN
ncbi:MAG: hypothetical protein JXR95_13685 [Deltaproteobacteria bacterium]|nr:hypothetical protein [Deltaproteobacteria bacterium]